MKLIKTKKMLQEYIKKKLTAVEFLETRAKEREKNNPNETAYWHLKELKKDFNHAKEIENWLNKQMYLKGIENYDPTFKQQEQ